MSTINRTQKILAGSWWLAELSRQLRVFISKPHAPGNLDNLINLLEQYRAATGPNGTVTPPQIDH